MVNQQPSWQNFYVLAQEAGAFVQPSHCSLQTAVAPQTWLVRARSSIITLLRAR